MDVCPVGAITTRDYRFKSRPWDNPHAVDTICTLCSKGCNTTAWIKAKPEWAKGSRLIRFTPRFNPDVNGYWMCDIGRFDYHWIEGDDRAAAAARCATRRRAAAAGVVARRAAEAARSARGRGHARIPTASASSLSAHASHEELFLFRRLAEELLGDDGARRSRSAGAIGEKPQPDGTKFKVPAVDAPNVNGARMFGLRRRPGDERRGGRVGAAARASKRAGWRRCTSSIPGPDGSLGDVDVDRRRAQAAARCRCSSCRACC